MELGKPKRKKMFHFKKYEEKKMENLDLR